MRFYAEIRESRLTWDDVERILSEIEDMLPDVQFVKYRNYHGWTQGVNGFNALKCFYRSKPRKIKA
jgi:hypothetical protein